MRPSVPRILRDNSGNPIGVVERVRTETALCRCGRTFHCNVEVGLTPTGLCERCRDAAR